MKVVIQKEKEFVPIHLMLEEKEDIVVLCWMLRDYISKYDIEPTSSLIQVKKELEEILQDLPQED